MDAIPIHGYVINKSATHGARRGKTEVQREYQKASIAWKRCCKNVISQGEHITCIHDRFLRDPVYRESQVAIGWSEQKCKEWRRRLQGKCFLTLNKAGKNGPVTLRSDFPAAVTMRNRLHHESGSKLKSLSIQIHTVDERRSFFLKISILLVTFRFVYSR